MLYSERKDRFYIGSTALDTDLRITQHLKHFYGKSKFTAVADDWILFLSIECKDLHQARKMEHHIKRMKSR
ncbi:MAG: GIY-YIG nuclease family protein, partial [Bacteroidota bacterium]